jgi:glutamyl-tRNA reductase
MKTVLPSKCDSSATEKVTQMEASIGPHSNNLRQAAQKETCSTLTTCNRLI